MQQLKGILAQNLNTDAEMLVFELSDGSRGTREIARLTGLGSNATVINYWKKWSKLGIVVPSTKIQGRYQHICSLEEVGLTVPELSHQAQTQEQGQQEVGRNE